MMFLFKTSGSESRPRKIELASVHCGLPMRVCVCGAHSSIGHFHRAPPPLDLVRVESNIITNFDDH